MLSDPTEIPPYRETAVEIPLSHCVSCGIADYRCYIPTSFRKNGLYQYIAVQRQTQQGALQKKLASEAYHAIGEDCMKWYRQSRYSGTLSSRVGLPANGLAPEYCGKGPQSNESYDWNPQ